MTHPKVRANTIDTGFIERELKKLTPEAPAPQRSRTVRRGGRHRRRGAQSAPREAHSPWQTSGWMPVGRRQRVFTFRQGQGAEHKVSLIYGNGPTTLSIGDRELAFVDVARPMTAASI